MNDNGQLPANANQENRQPRAANLENQENQGPQADINNRLFRESFIADPPALIPRPSRQYGYRPRGVILRFRNPPQWTRTLVGKEVLKELNFQEYFNRKIDAAYDVTKWAIFKSYSSLVSYYQLLFITALICYLMFLYSFLHNSLDNYYFVVTKEI